MSERLILFSKRPVRGRVKTRTVPPLTTDQALDLHLALLRDALGLLRSVRREGLEIEWRLDGPWRPDPRTARAAHGIPRSAQGTGDLGARLIRAFHDSARLGARATVIIGSDSPTLPAERIDQAFAALSRGAAAVAAPAEDGGYVLVGLRRVLPPLFQGIPWGSDGVMAATRDAATRLGVDLHEIPGWHDVDDAADLERLRLELAEPETAARAPATARFLESMADLGAF